MKSPRETDCFRYRYRLIELERPKGSDEWKATVNGSWLADHCSTKQEAAEKARWKIDEIDLWNEFMIAPSVDGQSFYLLEGNKVHARYETLVEAIEARRTTALQRDQKRMGLANGQTDKAGVR